MADGGRGDGENGLMSPVEDDPDMWAALMRAMQQVTAPLSPLLPFLAPAFVGSLIGAGFKRYWKKGVWNFVSMVVWSTATGAVLTPLFTHMMSLPDTVSVSAASFIGIFGHAVLARIGEKFGIKEEAVSDAEKGKGKDG